MFDTPPSTLPPAITPSNPDEINGQTAEQNAATPIEKPLELTAKLPTLFSNALVPALKSPKFDVAKLMSTSTAAPTAAASSDDHKSKSPTEPTNKIARNRSPTTNSVILNEPSAASLPPSDLVLPPPPPMWYPPLYPPYGIDPLHFFIDLRVSGHIYDRKKENVSPTSTSNVVADNNNTSIATNFESPNQLSKRRIGSAFSVPPRREKSPLALNLTSATVPSHERSNDNIGEYMGNNTDTDGKQLLAKNTNYVLQNLPRIYTTLTGGHGSDDRLSVVSDEYKSDSELPDYDAKDNERSSEHSDDVVIVDHDADTFDRKYAAKKSHKM